MEELESRQNMGGRNLGFFTSPPALPVLDPKPAQGEPLQDLGKTLPAPTARISLSDPVQSPIHAALQLFQGISLLGKLLPGRC